MLRGRRRISNGRTGFAGIIPAVFLWGITVIAAGCGAASPEHPAARAVADMSGRVVSVPEAPSRVLSLCTSATDTMVRLGLCGALAAIDDYGRIVSGAEGARVVGRGSVISKEQIMALRIDLAFVWWYQEDAAHMLEGLSIPVFRIGSPDIFLTGDMIRKVGDALNARDEAGALAAGVDAFVRRNESRAASDEYPSVYFELYGENRTAGGDSYIGRLIELAGGRNIASELAGNVLFSSERLIEADPEVILFIEEFANADEIAARPGAAGTAAAASGRIYPVSREVTLWGAGTPHAVEELRDILKRNSNGG